MEIQRLIAICMVGLACGAVFGAFLRTQAEADSGARRLEFWSPFDRRSVMGMLLNEFVKLAFIVCSIVALGGAAVHLGELLPLSKSDAQLLATAWLAGVGVAKWLRFRYWKSQPA